MRPTFRSADTVEGGTGADTLDGGTGLDTLSFARATAGVRANIAASLVGGDKASGFENLAGSRYADTLYGNGLANTITGGSGRDVIAGRGGADRLYGGAGADRFVYASVADSPTARPDTIVGFSVRAGDRIDLRTVDANRRMPKRQRFTYIGSSPFGGKPGELRFARGALLGDVNGDRRADFRIRIPGVANPARGLLLR